MTDQTELEQRAINVIRGLAMDAPEAANSGHPGTAMALAPLAHVLWTRVMNYDAADPDWPDRDRFVLSAGHASILLYSMLYLTGFGLDARRPPAVPPVGLGARRATPRCTTPRASRSPPGRSARASPTASAWHRRALPARPVRRRGGRPPHVRDLRRRRPRGGHQPRGGVARRPPRARPARRTSTTTTTSRSTAPPSWRYSDDAGQALRGVRLARRADRRGRQRPRRARGGAARAAWRSSDRAVADRAAQPHRLPVAQVHRHREGPRQPARRRRDRGDQGDPRAAARRDLLRARRRARALPRRPACAARALREAWQNRARRLRPATAPRGTPAWRGTGPRGLGRQAADVGGRREARHPQASQQGASTRSARRACPAWSGGGADLTGNTGMRARRTPSVQSPGTTGRPPDPLRHPRARHGRGA